MLGRKHLKMCAPLSGGYSEDSAVVGSLGEHMGHQAFPSEGPRVPERHKSNRRNAGATERQQYWSFVEEGGEAGELDHWAVKANTDSVPTPELCEAGRTTQVQGH